MNRFQVSILFCIGAFVAWQQMQLPTEPALQLTMLDIGQGDAIYIRTPQGQDILIDGGPDRRILYELGEVMPAHDHIIEYVIATHPDADHIAGLAELPEYYTIQRLLTPGTTKDTGFSAALEQWQAQGIHVQEVKRGDRLTIEDGLTLDILHPVEGRRHPDVNDDSIVALLNYNGYRMLFTGDASAEIEQQLIADPHWRNELQQVDLLKVGHHGSRTSTSRELVNLMQPSIALISAGIDNKFNHPHAEPLHRLQQAQSAIWRTDIHGRIACRITATANCISKKMPVNTH